MVFNDICDVLKEILESNILVISKKGKVLGTGVLPVSYTHLDVYKRQLMCRVSV